MMHTDSSWYVSKQSVSTNRWHKLQGFVSLIETDKLSPLDNTEHSKKDTFFLRYGLLTHKICGMWRGREKYLLHWFIAAGQISVMFIGTELLIKIIRFFVISSFPGAHLERCILESMSSGNFFARLYQLLGAWPFFSQNPSHEISRSQKHVLRYVVLWKIEYLNNLHLVETLSR